ncbi:MAG: nitrite/sulfite reductase [Proteobacteria bacterium]|jgi:sulfite reductase (NADPH) hemoprotein beta-component|nr:nitrite/sulfite reductase [Pseudomonadota bacterium]MBT5064887.1 nitrite/sulfite reductase [Pseudomonadota bacterium]MBT6193764.1 nitrite/sulfite reductase [Pseudomonadota bacterium]MBT6674675.1 nitrite/sulfite reductase [Pseudomonadota bacterium]MBT7245503.1 nitrite/sulfite reductase [Pseudomonadota bacterium]
MYQYTDFDQTIVEQRVSQFREQTQRFLNGDLDEDVFQTLRLQNGLYIQEHAPMLRIAIPYGTLSSKQLRKLADLCRKYDRGYGHFTTRQNIQLNWLKLEQVPDLLEELTTVQMHAIQTSGNCIRNITTDPLAGTVFDEAIDPRVICEIIRQWATLHPEFAYLPRKFKIAVTATEEDRAAIEVHDIGIRIRKGSPLKFDLWVGGGLGRTPFIGQKIEDELPIADILIWLNAVLRVYNLYGRRDNKYKARIKILLQSMGYEKFKSKVKESLDFSRQQVAQIKVQQITELEMMFNEKLVYNELDPLPAGDAELVRWIETNTHSHKVPGYRSVVVPLKRTGTAPGDVTSEEMDYLARLSDIFSLGELRTTHDQNLVFPHVKNSDLGKLRNDLQKAGLAASNRGLITDTIACPGLDFCKLANAPTIVLAQEIQDLFGSIELQHEIGPLEIKMSGCMNACGHHHIGHIGILGVDKKGTPWYQITLGGKDQNGSKFGDRLGPSIPLDDVIPCIKKIVDKYLLDRNPDEWFVDTVNRLGAAHFKGAAYAVD